MNGTERKRRKQAERGRIIATLALQGWQPRYCGLFKAATICWDHREHGAWKLQLSGSFFTNTNVPKHLTYKLTQVNSPLHGYLDWDSTTMPTLRRLVKLHKELEQLAEASA